MNGGGDDLHDDFYIGYYPAMTGRVARPVRRAVAGLLLLALGLAATRALVSEPFAPAVFEFGRLTQVEGTLVERPVPRLVLSRPGTPTPERTLDTSSYLLVAEGKSGAAELIAGLDGRRAVLTGTLIHRQGHTLLELPADGIALSDPEPGTRVSPPPVQALGTATFTGEIVDSKCWTGVMNPGEGKTHRACAIRCLSGGIPAVLAVPGVDGAPPTMLLLVDADGGTVNHAVLDLVAEPVTITGRLSRHGDLLVLAADPADYARLR